jgi:2-succinyl-6-hydroxy-2,4-cyclohexadiene-1-carboxylate synthase
MLVLLHGFAGTGRAWDPVLSELGETPYLAPTIGAAVPELPAEPVALTGYSMGGRIALHMALAEPDRVERLVLVSTTAGMEGEEPRRRRRQADEELAARIEAGTIEEFADAWMAQPIFDGTPPPAAALWREDLLRNDPATVAAQLRAFGAGVMEPVWERLHELTMPVDVVAGERDLKYCAIAERLVAGLSDARLHVIPGAGHGLPREAAWDVSRVVRDRSAPR